MKVNITPNSIITFIPSFLEASYYILYYTINEKENTINELDIGFSTSHSIKLNDIQEYIFSVNHFVNNAYILYHFYSTNCNLNIIESSGQSEAFSHSNQFYQFILKEQKDYTFKVTLQNFLDNDNNNSNDTCIYYSYGTNTKYSKSIILIEGVPFTTRLTPEHNIIYYEFPFVFDDKLNCFLIDFDIISLFTIDVKITMNDFPNSAQIKTFSDKHSHYITMDYIKDYCTHLRYAK